MPAKRVWVRGVPGRLARAEQGGSFLPIDRWTAVPLTNFVQRKADAGDLTMTDTDPAAKPKKVEAYKPAEHKEAE